MSDGSLPDRSLDFQSEIPGLVCQDPRVEVGRFTYGAPRLLLWAEHERIYIGGFCSIADEVTIFGGGEHRTDWITTFPLRIAFGDPLAGRDGHPATRGATRIGNDVWLAYRATVLSGVTIGHGAVVGAGAVVASDIPPYAVVAGNPARVVRYRFPQDVIAKLIELRWWDWPLDKIRRNMDILCSPDHRRLLSLDLRGQ
jgi:acetyltransferase-like isoleucine patch superfamily enzyme